MLETSCDLEPPVLAGDRGGTAANAHLLAEWALHTLPDRMAHSLLAGAQARSVCSTVADADVDLLVSAALLHDIGYSPALIRTGFHAIDGANFLLSVGAPIRLASLVAHHSECRFLARAAGRLGELSRFPREQGAVADALAYADMTAGPDGTPMTVHDRLEEIAARHADDGPRQVAARRARAPYLLAAAQRVWLRAADPERLAV